MLGPMLLNSIASSSATSTPTPNTTPNRTPTPNVTPTPIRARCSFPLETKETIASFASWSPQHFDQRMIDTNTSEDSTLERQTDISGFSLQESNHQSTLKNSYQSHNAHNHLNQECGLDSFSFDAKQLSLGGHFPIASMTGPIKRGLLWQQRDRLFSRWKERYFVLTRDYLHCFKRASGSSIEHASDMGQFLFKVKLIDVEKVEWLTRRSYTTIGLLLAREGRVLLRCDSGLLDWFKLLEECTITSKERRKALNISQSPRSRASLAAPISHASLQSQYFGLSGSHFNDLNDCWLNNSSSASGLNFTDSNENRELHCSRQFTNHSEMPNTTNSFTHKSMLRESKGDCSEQQCRYLNNFSLQKNGMKPVNDGSLYASSKRLFVNSSLGLAYKTNEDDLGDEQEVELRRHRHFQTNHSIENEHENENENESLDLNYLYRKPKPPTESRHSIQPLLPTHSSTAKPISDKCNWDKTASSIHQRPLSYREKYNSDYRNVMTSSTQKLTPTLTTDLDESKHFASSLAFLGRHLQKQKQQQQQLQHQQQFNKLLHSNVCGSITSSSRLNTQDQSHSSRIYQSKRDDHQKIANRQWQLNKPNTIDTNNHNFNNRISNKSTESLIPGTILANKYLPYGCNNTANMNDSFDTINNNHSVGMLSRLSSKISSMYGQRYDRHQQRQMAAATTLESNDGKCRDRSYSDCYQRMQRCNLVNNNPTPLTT